MEAPDEIAALHTAIIRAARRYIDENGWGVLLGPDGVCHACQASLWNDEGHAEGCTYDALRLAVTALREAQATPTR